MHVTAPSAWRLKDFVSFVGKIFPATTEYLKMAPLELANKTEEFFTEMQPIWPSIAKSLEPKLRNSYVSGLYATRAPSRVPRSNRQELTGAGICIVKLPETKSESLSS